MNPDDQPSTPSKPPGASRPGATGMWQAPSVEEMQAMLPQYEILEILGRGGMGAVYKGRQKSLKRLVAIKILPPDAADDEMRFVERFENEAQTMAAMNHPAIVAVYDFGETAEGLLYFIMEFVDGTDVHKMIQASGKLGDDYALAITAHVCDALDYAHSRGVIHRDIKPANILIDQEGRVKVADFGLAKMHDPSMTSGLTRTNMAMGTPDYVAPEALTMGMVVDHRADLYAVGVMLYQMLTGEVPRGMFRMPSEKGIGTDPRFDEIICKAMESDREHRYQTASDVRHSLDVILTTPQPKNDGTGVVPLEAIPRKVVLNVPGGPIGQSAVVPSRSQAPPPKKVAGKAVAAKGGPAKGPVSPSGKSSAGLWVTVVGVVAAIAVAAIFLMGGKPEPAAKVQPASVGSVSTSPVDAAFLAQVAAAPAARQVELVTQKIEALNGTKVKVEPTIKGEKVTGLRMIKSDASVPDISPLAALKDLDSLYLEYVYPTDISCLRGLKLVNLTVWGGEFTAVSVLQSFPLQTLSLKQISVSDFSVLKGKAIQRLDLELCVNLSDLSFVKGMPLQYLFVPKTKVRDLSPISGSPLIELVCDPEAKLDPALLASIPTLKKINLKPVSEWLSGSINAPPSETPGKVIDLLALVDVKRDTVAGEWVRTAEGLVKTGGVGGGPRLQLPYQPAEEYDFEIEFTPTDGIGNIGQIIAAQGREFGWMLNTGDQGNHRAGFGLLDGKKTTEVTETTAPLKEGIVDGRRYRSRVEVRAGRLRAFLDDTEIVNWTGDFSRLANDVTGKLRDSGHIGLRLNRDAVFHKITVREVSGAGKVDARTATTSSFATLKTIDLLALVDVKRDTIIGEWSRDGGDLLVKAAKPDDNGTPRLQIPYQPPEEYDFEIEFTPGSGRNMVGQILSAYQRSFSWFLDSQTSAGSKAGFDALDGISVSSRTDGTTMRPKFLTNGQRHRSTIEVRRSGMRALLDGEVLLKWGSAPNSYDRLDISQGEKLRDAMHLGLAAYDRNVRFHKITVREITGTGTVDAGTSSGAQKKQANLEGWTDWLGPKLATGTFGPPVWKAEKDGLTSEKPISGRNILPGEIRDASVRVTYDLRGSSGIQISARERIGKPGDRQLYVAHDTGVSLYIARMLPDGTIKSLISRDYPNQTPRAATRTLEFRCLGETLTATVTGSTAEPFIVTATDTALQSGTVSVSLTKGVLLRKVEIADGKETVGGAMTAAKLDEDFIRAVAAAPPEEQVSLVTAKLNEINGAQANLVPTIMDGKVKFLRVERKGDALLLDISPLAALKDLTDLRMMYVGPADISCLGGLPLERLEFHGGSFEDLSVLQSMPLRFLGLHSLSPSSQEALDFTILRGMKLGMLHLSSKRLEDISFIKGMPLKDLSLTGSAVRDFSPIAGMPLIHLEFAPEAKPDLALLRSIPTLKTINKRPAAEYLKTPDGASATWTDWLTPKLASGSFDGGQWKREAEGFTTDQSIAGFEVLPAVTRDGAMRVTFAMRGSEGVMINVRDTKVGNGSHQYTAQYTGTSLYLAHASNRLITEPMPAELRDRTEHTLEFRFEGENLTAILNDTHRISTRHSELTAGLCTVVLTKGVLVKKIEVQTSTPTR